MRKILFNDKFCLTQEVLAGNKTMTRRSFVRFEPDAHMFDEICKLESGLNDKGKRIFTLYNENGYIIGDLIPHYEVGDIVAIAQSYKTIYAEMIEDFAKHNYHLPREDAAEQFKKEYENTAGWNNKMFVKSELMRHHIKITDIKIERLQDISEEDALREGIEEFCFDYFLPNDYSKPFLMPRDAFAFLIDKVGKKGDWDKNPLVAAYTFELVD